MNNPDSKNSSPQSVEVYVPEAERNRATQEGPRAFIHRMEDEARTESEQQREVKREQVRENVQAQFARYANNRDEALGPAMAQFARDVAARRLGDKGTTDKRSGFRIDTEGRKPDGG